MTYFGFLLIFLALPLVFFLAVTFIDGWRGKTAPGFLNGRAEWMAIGLLVLLAVLYTTPWDNYLVATRVWYYNPELISGIVLGWVPVEEYIFFILETILTGLWWWFLVRRIRLNDKFKPGKNIRFVSTAILGAVWLWLASLLISGWKPAAYLSMIIVWALPPIMLQLAFGADILWHHRKLIALVILPVFVYISAADSIAISSGTWTINPVQSLDFFIGPLPVEEAVFFLSTVMIIAFGLTLSLARFSQVRWREMADRLQVDCGDERGLP